MFLKDVPMRKFFQENVPKKASAPNRISAEPSSSFMNSLEPNPNESKIIIIKHIIVIILINLGRLIFLFLTSMNK